jgi:hypothetical protein
MSEKEGEKRVVGEVRGSERGCAVVVLVARN